MGLIKKSSIDALREKVDIVSLIGNYVTLRRSGSYWKGLSPFSNEKTPSFFVSPDRKIFKCFSSGLGGDVFRFLELKEQMTFLEAAEFLADRYHCPLEYEGSRSKGDTEVSRSVLLAVHEEALKYYVDFFFSSHFSAHRTREYWINERKFSLATAEKYAIGLAPPDGREFLELMTRKFSEKILLTSGLVLRPEGRTTLTARFRGRLMIPIRDTNGRVIAFSGRAVPLPDAPKSGEAKYINSPETPIFHKGNVVFGLDQARKNVDERHPFVLVEGQLDCLRCWECGIETAVAPEGTAITEEQLLLLHRHCPELHSVLDGDAAGHAAALRLIPLAIKCGLDLRVVTLPAGEDPDSILRNHGLEHLNNLLEKGQSIVGFLRDHHLAHFSKLSPMQKKSGLEKIYEQIALFDSRVAEFEALKELADLLGTDESALKNDYVRFSTRRSGAKKVTKTKAKKIVDVWEELLSLILNNDSIIGRLEPLVDPAWIDHSSLPSRILNFIIGEVQNGETLADTIHRLSDSDQNYVAGLMICPADGGNLIENINQILAKIHGNFLRREMAAIDEEIKKKSPQMKNLLTRRMELKRQILQPPRIE